ncbi:MAG: glycosyltransferase [Oscillospiraceae bacterium]|nr:glycosyltransferase [Oscillospiraceae bacterium]
MKVLIISHNALGDGTNMGQTLQAWFQDFSPEELAQFYIRGIAPGDGTVCRKHYRFTDVDALRSLVGRRRKQVENSTAAKAAYRYGRKRTALSYLLRDTLWKNCRWNGSEFWGWAEAFAPDVVFLASGDHGFLYDVAAEIAARLDKPLVAACVDDFYLYDRWDGEWLGAFSRRRFWRSVQGAMDRAEAIFTICPAMAGEYDALFGKKCRVLYTPADPRQEAPEDCTGDIIYLGNVSLKRNEQLAQIGRALQKLDIPGGPKVLHVYSGEQDPQMLQGLTPENGISFHGAVDREQARALLRGALAAVHVESFDAKLRSRLRFSISTKIPQILAEGPCLIAYGPEGIASMDYLKENGGAFTITDPAELEDKLGQILSDTALRREIRGRGRLVAEQNHRPGALRRYLEELL